ncbi:MAG TPA: TMEM175 family protein, partial [Cyclobacteriaceae bacterium]
MSVVQKSFPYDRVNNFSDAIFAIGITLLVLEVKVPTAMEMSELGVGGLLDKRIPYFIGYFVSFMVTALYWRSHLQLFQWVKAIDNKLLWLNLWLLFFVVLLPFSTALYSYFFTEDSAFACYCLNLAAIGFMSYLMTVYVVKKESLAEQIGVDKAK